LAEKQEGKLYDACKPIEVVEDKEPWEIFQIQSIKTKEKVENQNHDHQFSLESQPIPHLIFREPNTADFKKALDEAKAEYPFTVPKDFDKALNDKIAIRARDDWFKKWFGEK